MIMKKYITFNDTSIKLNKNSIKKTFLLKTIPKSETKKVSKNINKYYLQLKQSGVRLPKLIKYKDLQYTFEYCGNSLIDVLNKKTISEKRMINIIEQILSILKSSINNKTSLDPHIKNFTIKNNIVYYVDTFPPVTEEYIKILIKANAKNKSNILKHLSTWKPHKIMYHYLADLKKTRSIDRRFYFLSKKLIISKGYIRKFSIEKVNHIINIESSNLENRTFTLS